jgi:hypothetical protein
VPPVTAERSPPLSRMTGALSPVMAASLTLAMPSMISPSVGITSPASTRITSPGTSLWAAVGMMVPVFSSMISLALVVTRVARRLSAAALPRPSATLSARLANSTVAQSQPAIWIAKPAAWWFGHRRDAETVDSRATIQVAKITGLPVSLRGSSLTKASLAARARIGRRTGRRPGADLAPALPGVDSTGVIFKSPLRSVRWVSAWRPRRAPGSARRSVPAPMRGRIAGRPGSGSPRSAGR